MYRQPVNKERDYQEFHLVLCRHELFELHQALTVLPSPNNVQVNLRMFIQNLLYPNSAGGM